MFDDFLELDRPSVPYRTEGHAGDGFLPTTVRGRVALGVLSAVVMPVAAATLYFATYEPPKDLGHRLIVMVFWQIGMSIALICACGLTWAVARPEWVRPLVRRQCRRLAWAVGLLYAVMGLIVAL